ncbi:CaiF/GrlA family transcriptional regulator [Erwinia sp. E_sp_B04_7]|uniref:CaiF/GrlA family transcriptional regulator n=1 Tax=unclassified Erwinia TaxID=2622719 RepID=UPI0030D14ED5
MAREDNPQTEPSMRKIVKQRNHDSAMIPAGLQEHADKPLYMLIALWCCRQKTWIDRQQISDAFAITERRATFQITYILRHNKRINCQSRKIRGEQTGRIRLQINVQKVDLDRRLKNPEAAAQSSALKLRNGEEHRENLRWVLSRQPPQFK